MDSQLHITALVFLKPTGVSTIVLIENTAWIHSNVLGKMIFWVKLDSETQNQNALKNPEVNAMAFID